MSEQTARERIAEIIERQREYHRSRVAELEGHFEAWTLQHGDYVKSTLSYQGGQVAIAWHRLVLAYLGDGPAK